MTIEIKELKKHETNDETERIERVRISELLTTHQNELRPNLLDYFGEEKMTALAAAKNIHLMNLLHETLFG